MSPPKGRHGEAFGDETLRHKKVGRKEASSERCDSRHGAGADGDSSTSGRISLHALVMLKAHGMGLEAWRQCSDPGREAARIGDTIRNVPLTRSTVPA